MWICLCCLLAEKHYCRGSSDVAGEIGPLWLTTSKIAIKAKHLQTAYSAILQANQLKADFAFVESAKLHRANEQSHRALQEMEQGLKLLGVFETNSSTRPSYDSVMAQRLAKVRAKGIASLAVTAERRYPGDLA